MDFLFDRQAHDGNLIRKNKFDYSQYSCQGNEDLPSVQAKVPTYLTKI